MELKYDVSKYDDDQIKNSIDHLEITTSWADSMGHINIDFLKQLNNIFLGAHGFNKNNVFDEKEFMIVDKIKEIENLFLLISEFYFQQVDYIEKNVTDKSTESAPSTCKKAIAIMAVFNLKLANIPFDKFQSPYEWLLYVTLVALIPNNLKHRVEIIPQYEIEVENVKRRIDFCIFNIKNQTPIIGIECNGTSHWKNEECISYHNQRQNMILTMKHISILNYSNSDIYNYSFDISKEIWSYVFSKTNFSKRIFGKIKRMINKSTV